METEQTDRRRLPDAEHEDQYEKEAPGHSRYRTRTHDRDRYIRCERFDFRASTRVVHFFDRHR